MRCAVSNHVQLACVLVCQLNDYFITEDAKGNRSSSGCVFNLSKESIIFNTPILSVFQILRHQCDFFFPLHKT